MKKALVVFLAVAMLFAFSAAALAAPADLDGQPTNVQDAFNKFLAFKFIEGYEDGTVRPNGEITRAEFAKVICMVTGLSDVANALQNTSSQYKDVLAGKWYVGFVAAATASGFFQGYGDGTFRPDNLVTEYEVLAVLLRVAGYKDEGLSGAWPYNYVTQASRLGWLSLVSVTGANATRATAVLLANTALFEDFVAYSKDSGLHASLNPKQTVAAYYKSLGDTKPVVVKNFGLNKSGVLGLFVYEGAVVDKDGNYVASALADAAAATAPTTFYPLFDNYDVVDGTSVYDMVNIYAKVTLTKDNKVAYIEPIANWVTTNTFKISGNVLTINSVAYNSPFIALSDYYKSGDGNYRFLIDAENNILLNAYKVSPVVDATKYGVVGAVKDGVLTVKKDTGAGSFATAANMKDKKVLVLIDGVVATLADVKVNDFAAQIESKYGYDYIFYVVSAKDTAVSTITGNSSLKIVDYTVDGKKYLADSDLGGVKTIQGTDAPKVINVTEFNSSTNPLKGKAAVATFTADGKLAFLTYGARADATTVVGVLTGGKVVIEQVFDGTNYVNKPAGYEEITIFTANGETKKYNLVKNGKEWAIFGGTGTWKPLVPGTLVTLAFDENDELVEAITNYPSAATATSATVGGNIFTPNAGSALTITDATRVFVIGGTATAPTYTLTSLTTNISGDIMYLPSNNGLEVRYVVVSNMSAGATGLVGVIQGLFVDGDRVKFRDLDTTYKKADFAAGDIAANDPTTDGNETLAAANHNIIVYTVSGSGINATATRTKVLYDGSGTKYAVKAATSNLFSYIITAGVEDDPATPGDESVPEVTATARFDADTIFYVYNAAGSEYTGPGAASDLSATGAKIQIIETKTVDSVVIVTKVIVCRN